jgi:hypothetical protein
MVAVMGFMRMFLLLILLLLIWYVLRQINNILIRRVFEFLLYADPKTKDLAEITLFICVCLSFMQKSYIEKVVAENPGLPCFCFGHSTGAAIILKVLIVGSDV